MNRPLNDEYRRLLAQAEALTDGMKHPVANAANLAALIFNELDRVNWAGFYFLEDETLIVGPFQGLPACVEIPLGRGVCGRAAAQRETLRVDDVHAFEDHIVCDAASASEVVVPLVVNDRVIGVLDIDSPEPARFDADDVAGLEALAALYCRSVS